jgi:hypothetical protein
MIPRKNTSNNQRIAFFPRFSASLYTQIANTSQIIHKPPNKKQLVPGKKGKYPTTGCNISVIIGNQLLNYLLVDKCLFFLCLKYFK